MVKEAFDTTTLSSKPSQGVAMCFIRVKFLQYGDSSIKNQGYDSTTKLFIKEN